jgi:DNA adenine methylase
VFPEQFPLFGSNKNDLRAKPFLKWAGGKTHLLPVLRQCLPATFQSYFEPFLGGGALFFGLGPDRAVLSDSNEELIQCYEVVRDSPDRLIDHLAGMRVSEKEFYRLRAIAHATLPPVSRAARFIYLNKTCYNGLYRVNKKGQFNTPFGRYEAASLVEANNLLRASRLLQRATLRCADYRNTLEHAREGDFIYLDPPYLPVGRYSDFKRYTKESFYESDHIQLAQQFRRLADAGCVVLLSNSYHEKIASLYADFHQATVAAPRYVNCKGEGRGKIKELLISNYPVRIDE